MREEDVISTLKDLKQIKATSAFRHTLKRTLEQQPVKKTLGMPSLKAIGLTFAMAALVIVMSAAYLNRGPVFSPTGAAPAGQAETPTPTPPPPPPPAPPTPILPDAPPLPDLPSVPPTPIPPSDGILDYSIILKDGLQPTPPPMDPDDPMNDIWVKTVLTDEMLEQDQPFPVLFPTALPEWAELHTINLITTKFNGNGVELQYSTPSSAGQLLITQFVDDTSYGLSLDPEKTTLYTVGDSDAACYPIHTTTNVFSWSKDNYILEMFSSLPCNELYDIAVSVQ